MAGGSDVVDFPSHRGSRIQLEGVGSYLGTSGVVQPPRDYRCNPDDYGVKAMSMTQTVIGGGVLFAVGSAILQVVLPAPAPITVHSLAFEYGFVIQDRTVTTSEPFWASWAAQVINADTGQKVDGCFGEGAFAYEPGNKVARLSLQEWVGSDDCSLSSGSYYLAAAWYWGDSQLGAKSDVFEVK